MTRANPGRILLPLTALLLGAPTLSACRAPHAAAGATDRAADREPPRRPNVLLLFADDQRPDAVGAFGNPHIRTPNLDRIVNAGFRFARNYCMGSVHGAVCQPSRAMLMSGRTLYRVPMRLEGVPTFPEALRAAGYETFMTGKWHNGPDSLLRSFEAAKAVFLGGMSNHERVPLRDIGVDGNLTNQRVGESFSSELFADAAIEFLEGHDPHRPFFAYVSFTAPHDPRQPPEQYRRPYYEAHLPLPANFMPQHPFHNGWMTGRDEQLAAWPRSEQVLRDQLAEYYGLITHMDAQIGRILDALEAAGHGDDTVIVFSADHGLALGSHGLLGKQNLYEHSMGCPLVIAGAGIPHGSSAALTYLLDLFPTLCEVTGTAIPDGVEGRSLAPIWAGEAQAVRDTLFTTYEDKMRAVRDDRWKLIRYPLVDHTQLFDLERDPHELRDLAADPAQAARVERMLALLREWQEALDDPHPLVIDDPQPMEIDLSGREREPDRHQPAWIVEKYFGD